MKPYRAEGGPQPDITRFTLPDFYINHIKAGRKTIEVRKVTRFTQELTEGKIIEFYSWTQTIQVRVKNIRRYKNKEDLIEQEDPNLIIPGTNKQTIMQQMPETYKTAAGEFLALEIEYLKSHQ